MPAFGSVEWETRERAGWRNKRRTAYVMFWLSWAAACFMLFCVVRADGDALVVFVDTLCFAFNLTQAVRGYKLIRLAGDMTVMLDRIHEARENGTLEVRTFIEQTYKG